MKAILNYIPVWDQDYIISRSVDINDNTCLHCAVLCESNNADIVRIIFERAKKEVLFKSKNKEGSSALQLAIRENRVDVAKLLVDSAASIGHDTLAVFIAQSILNPPSSNNFLSVYRELTRAYPQTERCTNVIKIYETDFRYSRNADFKRRLQTEFGSRRRLGYTWESRFMESQSITNMSVIEVACQVGAFDLLQEILKTKDVYMFEDENYVLYDVGQINSKCLPRIARCHRREQIWKILDIEPFLSLTENIWKCGISLLHLLQFTFCTCHYLVTTTFPVAKS